MKLYLAGPMRGYHLHNAPAFFSAAINLRKLGHTVINPAEVDIANGLDLSLPLDQLDASVTDKMDTLLKEDFEAILISEAIALLPGWESSTGASAERVVAHYSGRGVYLYDADAPGALVQSNMVPRIEFVHVATSG